MSRHSKQWEIYCIIDRDFINSSSKEENKGMYVLTLVNTTTPYIAYIARLSLVPVVASARSLNGQLRR